MKKSMNHTPGPWKVFDGQFPIGTITVNKDVETRICTIEINDPYSAKESAQNAALISAAPDLLSALYSAREMLGVFEDNGGHDGMLGKGYVACLDQIDNAIKKATEDLKQFE